MSAKNALRYARLIIQNYEADIRNARWVGVELQERGFCQGTIYRDALGRIETLEANPDDAVL